MGKRGKDARSKSRAGRADYKQGHEDTGRERCATVSRGGETGWKDGTGHADEGSSGNWTPARRGEEGHSRRKEARAEPS